MYKIDLAPTKTQNETLDAIYNDVALLIDDSRRRKTLGQESLFGESMATIKTFYPAVELPYAFRHGMARISCDELSQRFSPPNAPPTLVYRSENIRPYYMGDSVSSVPGLFDMDMLRSVHNILPGEAIPPMVVAGLYLSALSGLPPHLPALRVSCRLVGPLPPITSVALYRSLKTGLWDTAALQINMRPPKARKRELMPAKT